jgi:hypothetical protein
MADFQQAAGTGFLVGQWLHVFFVHFDSDTLHDLLERQDNSETALLPHHDAFHSRKGPRPDTRKLPHAQQRMRLDSMLPEAGAQRLDRTVGKGRRLAPGASYHSQRSGNTQDAHSLGALNAYKNIAREKRQVQRYPGPVAPFPVRLVEGKVMLNFALTQMLRNAFFVAAGRIERKPARGSDYFRANVGQGRFDLSILENASLQGFAILTWVKVFHKAMNIGSKQQSGS